LLIIVAGFLPETPQKELQRSCCLQQLSNKRAFYIIGGNNEKKVIFLLWNGVVFGLQSNVGMGNDIDFARVIYSSMIEYVW
jgi:hypothetical protein